MPAKKILAFVRTSSAVNWWVAGANVFLAMATVFAAYGGYMDPQGVPVAALAPMFLGAILIADIVMLLLDAVFWRKACVPILLAWVASAKPLTVFAPLNTSAIPLTEEQERHTFTMLTYNCLHFNDNRGHSHDTGRNATIDFILETDPDIVNLQELSAEDLEPDSENAREWHITRGQLSQLRERYPFQFRGDAHHQTFLSKFPALHQELPLHVDSMPNISAYRVHIRGQLVRFYDVHLRSILLDNQDKQLFTRLTRGKTENLRREVRDVKERLIDKLTRAFDARAREARFLRACLDSIGGNAVVAGDFNDVPGCYAARTIMGTDMHDAYAQAGFGPVITFHGDRFYFRIDQVLYRGNLRALEMKRLRVPYSDHYPMWVKFYIGE